MIRRILVAAAAAALLIGAPALAKPEGKGQGHGQGADKSEGAEHSAKDHAPGQKKKRFARSDKRAVRDYFSAHPGEFSQLPPGLAKQGKVPPGWAKKLERGNKVPDDLWAIRVPLPHEVLAKLPPPGPGEVIFRVHDRVVRAIEHTHEVLDSFGIPHPPTPR